MTDIGKPIANCEVIKVDDKIKKGARYITLILNDGPDDDYINLVKAKAGDIFQIFVTTKDIGS